MTYISFLPLFCSFFPVYLHYLSPSCMVNKYYYIQHRGVTLKSNHSRSLKMGPGLGPIDRLYSRVCVTIMSSGVCFLSKQLAMTSFRRQVLSMLLVQQWRGSSGNVRLSNLLISYCYIFRFISRSPGPVDSKYDWQNWYYEPWKHRICLTAATVSSDCSTTMQEIELAQGTAAVATFASSRGKCAV